MTSSLICSPNLTWMMLI